MTPTSRRGFLETSSLLSAGYFVAAGSRTAWSNSANEQLNVACIGVGGKGSSDSDNAALFGNVIAICDVDRNTLESKGKAEKFQDAERFTDFRELLAKHGKKIDMCTISTPDHMHAPATLEAMRLGISCYTQKPLTRTIYEARLLTKVAKEMAEAIAASDAAAMQKKTARWTEHGGMKFRVPKPCRYASFFSKRLCVECDKEGVRSAIPEGDYVCRAVIPAQTRKNNIGDLYTTEARYCGAELSGCHNHETGTCIYVHPDEREWADACSGRLDTRFDNRLVFCLATDPAAMRNHRDAAPAHGGGRGGRGAPPRGGGRGAPPHGQRSYNQERPRPPAGAPNRFAAALAPQPQAKPQKAPQVKPQQAPPAPKKVQATQSRFGALEESSDEEDRSAW